MSYQELEPPCFQITGTEMLLRERGGEGEDKTQKTQTKISVEPETGVRRKLNWKPAIWTGSQSLAVSLPKGLIHLWSHQERPATSAQSLGPCNQETISSESNQLILVLHIQGPVPCKVNWSSIKFRTPVCNIGRFLWHKSS